MIHKETRKTNIAGVLLSGFGMILSFSALLYNEFLIKLFNFSSKISVGEIRDVQICFFAVGLAFFLFSMFTSKVEYFENLLNKTFVINTILVMFSLVLPAFILEMSLRPFAGINKSKLIEENVEVGWKFVPNSEGMCAGFKVKINSKGFRGPELDYAKPHDTNRIVYIGDSVLFGYGLKSYKEGFPYVAEKNLKNKFKANIETVNIGVTGYSPWQEYITLSNEGIKYDPDLVVVAFVMNDVTAKFADLISYGKYVPGKTSYFSFFSRLGRSSGIVYFINKMIAKRVFGGNIQKGAARRESLNVVSLARKPNDPIVKKSWEITLRSLDNIASFCKKRKIPVIFVIFPFDFQFYDINNLSSPQAVLTKYAIDKKIPSLNLLPILAKKMEEQGMGVKDYFLDSSHLSTFGNNVVGEVLADFIKNEFNRI